MAEPPEIREQRRDTRRLLVFGAAASAVLLIAIIGWFLYGLLPGKDADIGTAGRKDGATGPYFHQQEGESLVGKRTGPSPDESEVSRALGIIHTARGQVELAPDQKEKLREYFAEDRKNRHDKVDFAVQIGAAVPEKFELADLPTAAADALAGYQGSRYFILRDQLVIVDPQVRRIIAIVPGIAA